MPADRPDPSAPFWTVRQAASYLRMAESSVRLLIGSGRLTHLRVGPSGGRIRIRPAYVTAYLESCRVAAAGEAPQPAAPKRAGHGLEPAPDLIGEMMAKRSPRPEPARSEGPPTPTEPSAPEKPPDPTAGMSADQRREYLFQLSWVRVEHFAWLDEHRVKSRAARNRRPA